MRLSYQELVDNKICVACRYESAREGKTLCQKCADKQKKRDSLRKKVKNNIKCYGCNTMLYSQTDKFIGMYADKIKIVCASCLDFCRNHNCDNCHDETYQGFISDCVWHVEKGE